MSKNNLLNTSNILGTTPISKNFLERQKIYLNNSLTFTQQEELLRALDFKLHVYIETQNKIGNGGSIPKAINMKNIKLSQLIKKRQLQSTNLKQENNNETTDIIAKKFQFTIQNLAK